jgi:hypothetical protein
MGLRGTQLTGSIIYTLVSDSEEHGGRCHGHQGSGAVPYLFVLPALLYFFIPLLLFFVSSIMKTRVNKDRGDRDKHKPEGHGLQRKVEQARHWFCMEA